MFGYVLPKRSELKLKELEVYQSYYCGLCLQLKSRHHFLGRLSLSYDLVFLGILLTALYEPEESRELLRCILHPLRKHRMVQNRYISYVADMNLLLTYYKCRDDWQDEHRLSAAVYGLLLSRAAQRVRTQYPQKAVCLQGYLEALSALEKQEETNLDEVSGCFGNICAEIFVCEEDGWQPILQKIGFFLGKFIYLLDAYDDLEEDIRKKCYNPLSAYAGRKDFREWVRQILELNIAEASWEFEKLPVLEHAGILRNILYAGVWCRFEGCRKQKKKRCMRMEKNDDKSL